MHNRFISLTQLEMSLSRFGILRWCVRITLVILLLLSILNYGSNSQPALFGVFFIVLPAGIVIDLYHIFVHQELEKEEEKSHKIFGAYTHATARILVQSKGKESYLVHYLLQDTSVRFVMNRLGFPYKRMVEVAAQPPLYKDWLAISIQTAKNSKEALKPKHLFEVLQGLPGMDAVWRELGITPTERNDVWRWYERIESKMSHRKRTLVDTLKFSGGLGRDWASGYTKMLEQYATNITQQVEFIGRPIELTGHAEERQKILEYLSRDHTHNVLLIGEDGIGKERIIYSLASDFLMGEVPLNLKYKHVYLLDTGSVISAANQNELEMRLHALLNETASVGNIVLVIPDFHLLVGEHKGNEVGSINASSVLTGYLKSPSIQIIGVMTPDAYYTQVKPNESLEPYLLPIEVKEISSQDALSVLQDEAFRYEAKSKHVFTYQALAKIIQIADQHVHETPYPEKALQLLDEVAGAVNESSEVYVFPREVEKILGEKLKMPIGNVAGHERDVLNGLEQLIQTRIVGQKDAVGAVANALRRARAGLHSGKRPIGSFLFMGPTGVGKTEMAKTIAALYYKNEKAFVRLDMSEYQTPESIEKLVGTPTSPGLLTTAVTDQPFSVVLLDEIEKASQGVRNIFLQILDDGHVTDGYGKRVDFTNAMVIATSNAGAQFIRESVESNTVDVSFKQRLLDYIQSQGIYSPEWLNRFDAVVVFLPLTRDEIRQVAKIQINDLITRLKTHDINLTVAEDVYDLLVEKGYDPQFGARPMRRAVQDMIETALAKTLLNDATEGTKDVTLTAAQLQS